MNRNPREPSEPAGDNPAGNTRGQIHRFQPEFRSNPNLTADQGRLPIPLSTISMAKQLITVVSTLSSMNASDSTTTIADPFASRGTVYHSPPHTTSVSDPGPAGTDIPQDLDQKATGSLAIYKKGTHSARTESGTTSPDRQEEDTREKEEVKAARQRRLEAADSILREASESAERMHLHNQREYENFQRGFERDRQERAEELRLRVEELREVDMALAQRREEFRHFDTEAGMVKARSEAEDRARGEAIRARIAAERASEEAEQELIRVRAELQRAQSEVFLQRGYAPGPLTLETAHITTQVLTRFNTPRPR